MTGVLMKRGSLATGRMPREGRSDVATSKEPRDAGREAWNPS